MLSLLESTELAACQWPFDRRRLIFPYPGEGAEKEILSLCTRRVTALSLSLSLTPHKEIERVVVAQGKEACIRTDFEKAVISGQIVRLFLPFTSAYLKYSTFLESIFKTKKKLNE